MTAKKKGLRKTKKTIARPIFDSVRKPTAPPSRVMGENKPAEKARPARRKAKHKSPPPDEE